MKKHAKQTNTKQNKIPNHTFQINLDYIELKLKIIVK